MVATLKKNSHGQWSKSKLPASCAVKCRKTAIHPSIQNWTDFSRFRRYIQVKSVTSTLITTKIATCSNRGGILGRLLTQAQGENRILRESKFLVRIYNRNAAQNRPNYFKFLISEADTAECRDR